MKVGNLFMLAALLPMLMLTGCKSDDDDVLIWDIYPITMYVYIADADGNNLLDPEVEGNIVDQPMTVEYKGMSYDVQWKTLWPDHSDTRAYLARFHGALHHPADVYNPASADNPWVLEIGELPGDEDYDETILLKYKNKVFNIRVVNKFTWTKGKPNVDAVVYLNGQRLPDRRLKIVL